MYVGSYHNCSNYYYGIMTIFLDIVNNFYTILKYCQIYDNFFNIVKILSFFRSRPKTEFYKYPDTEYKKAGYLIITIKRNRLNIYLDPPHA